MDKNTIIEEVIRSAFEYYDYLDKTGKGRIVSEVNSVLAISYKKKKGKSVFRLNLLKKLRNLENVFIEIDGVKYDNGVELVLWDDDKRDLVVAIESDSPILKLGKLDEMDVSRMAVVSDMKYLVRRVGDWFREKPIFLPTENCVRFSENAVRIASDCSKEQERAVKFALTHPFSYVWGAPGTGKTKFVLANCVINYLLRGEKVYVLAPTNNAAEQAVSAVIDLADTMHIPRSEILRIGTPSKEFADKYPEVCEMAGIGYIIKTRQEKEDFLREILAHKRRVNEYEKLKEQVEDEIARLETEVKEWGIVPTFNDLSVLDGIINGKLHSFMRLDCGSLDETIQRARSALTIYENELKADGSVYSAYDEDDEGEIAEKLSSLEEQVTDARRINSEQRIEKAKVVCATIDTFIHTFSGEQGKDARYTVGAAHIFLDEAGYSSIAKALTLFSEYQSVTFFGDHFQLPPVCEMNDDIIARESRSVCLWAQSALYIGDMFSLSAEEICVGYLNGNSPSFERMERTDLSTTYRFGQNLLDVLGHKVYDRKLTSVKGKDNLIIEYLDAQKQTESTKKRENPDEVFAVRMWLKANGCSRRNKSQSIAILSPYKNQVFALKKTCYQFVGDEIYTVHGSQGREWDTIILSVCDAKDMFFVDSENRRSRGRLILNTAISRAKKRLIIVCDYGFWSSQNKQLIAELLSIAEEGGIGRIANA